MVVPSFVDVYCSLISHHDDINHKNLHTCYEATDNNIVLPNKWGNAAHGNASAEEEKFSISIGRWWSIGYNLLMMILCLTVLQKERKTFMDCKAS